MLQGHVSSKDAHEMMMLMVMPCYDHAQMMPKCKANTWGVTIIRHMSVRYKLLGSFKVRFVCGVWSVIAKFVRALFR
jgi:hypothetical protein